MLAIFLLGIIIFTYLMVIAKRMTALIRDFRLQSLFLFLATGWLAIKEQAVSLGIIAVLIFVLKVLVIPQVLRQVMKKIKVKEDLGLFINVQLSMLLAILFSAAAWAFAKFIVSPYPAAGAILPAEALFIILTGFFLMIFRMTALAQVVGLLVMENGLFLLAAAISGGMPFFIEIAIFFDVLMSVIIMGFFVYRINKLFTHIDVNKLTRLRG
jgi:hydrogenase-4 component E